MLLACSALDIGDLVLYNYKNRGVRIWQYTGETQDCLDNRILVINDGTKDIQIDPVDERQLLLDDGVRVDRESRKPSLSDDEMNKMTDLGHKRAVDQFIDLIGSPPDLPSR